MTSYKYYSDYDSIIPTLDDEHHLYKLRYENACHKLKDHLRVIGNDSIPPSLLDSYRQNLSNLRNYLDAKGYKMPSPKFTIHLA